jgi:transposase
VFPSLPFTSSICRPSAETAHVARAAFPTGNLYMLLRDELGTLAVSEDFAPLFPGHGHSAEAPWRLALVTVFQFIEGLPGRAGRAAADVVRTRLDWKYALPPELADAGFDSLVLCEFRARLLDGHAEKLLFDKRPVCACLGFTTWLRDR